MARKLTEAEELEVELMRVRDNIVDLREQVKAVKIELVEVKLNVDKLKDETKELRSMNAILKLEITNSIELMKTENKPIMNFFKIASGLVITAIVTAILALILKN